MSDLFPTRESTSNPDVTIIDAAGRITLGEGAAALQGTVTELLKKNKTKLVLNFEAVSYVDTMGLGNLGSAAAFVKRGGYKLKLLDPSDKIQEILRITLLAKYFDIYTSASGGEEAAVRAFGPPRPLPKKPAGNDLCHD